MRTSEQINELAKSMAATQNGIVPPNKGKTAKIPTKNGGSYSYKYADLSDVIDSIRKASSNHGLSYIQVVEGGQLHTRLMHESGQWIQGAMNIPDGLSPQEYGSWLTYMRRYALCAAFGITADDDDDGQVVQEKATAPQDNTSDPGAFVVPYGKLKGTPLRQVSFADLQNNLSYWEARIKTDTKPPSQQIIDYISAMQACISAHDSMTSKLKQATDGDALVNEDIPF